MRGGGALLGAALGVSALLGLLSPSVAPAGPWWWVQWFGVGLPLTMATVGAAAVLALVIGRWRWLLLFAGILALFGWQVAPWERWGRPSPAAGDLVLLSFNVPRSGPSGEQLARDVAALIDEVGPDVVLLQEAVVVRGDEGELHKPLQIAGAQDSLGFSLLLPFLGRNVPTQIPILAQPSITALEQSRVPLKTASQGYARGSEAFRVRFRWQGREAVLYNLHLRSFGARKPWKEGRERLLSDTTWAGYANRYREAYQLRALESDALASYIEAETLPVLVAGDFNSAPANWSFQRLRRGLQDAQRVSGDRWWAPTFPAPRPVVRIDAVFADPAFEVVSVEVREEAFSDHRPVVVRLRWREEG